MSMDLAAPLATVLASIVDVMAGPGVPGAVATADGSGDAPMPSAGDAVGGVETAQRFLFGLPDEVKTILMVVLAIAIGVYLYFNYLGDRP